MSFRQPTPLTISTTTVESVEEVNFQSVLAYPSDSDYDRMAARVDFIVTGDTIEIYNWELNWRDIYPLEAIASHIQKCLYPNYSYVVTVEGPNLEFWLTQGFQYLTSDKLIN